MIAASNIAWSAEHDRGMYAYLAAAGCRGLEIAPTRIFPEAPYEHVPEARAFASRLREEYGLSVCSMQSVWYGVRECIADGAAARKKLVRYTEKAIAFAAACGCPNLVFGSPKNRSLPNEEKRGDGETVIPDAWYLFFAELGRAAREMGCVIALEANPPIYGTNFINTTREAFAFVREIGSPGLMVNLDIGTVIYECEGDTERSISVIKSIRENAEMVSHVHLSEPLLAPIRKRALHTQIMDVFAESGYGGCISVEMADTGRIADAQVAVRTLCGLSGKLKGRS